MGVLLGHRMCPAPADAPAPHERRFSVPGQRIDAVSPSNPDVVAEKHPRSNIALRGAVGALIGKDDVRDAVILGFYCGFGAHLTMQGHGRAWPAGGC